MTIFTSFSREGEKGLSVSQATQLRRLLRPLNSEYFVTKKTLVDLAFKDKGIDVFSMEGSLGLVLGDADAYEIAKKVYEFSKSNQELKFFGAYYDGKYIDNDTFMEMAKMPSREVLIGRLLGMMKYPISSLYIVLSEISKNKNNN